MSLKGNIGTLRKFSAGLRSFGKGVGHLVAQRAAPKITAEARKSYDAGTDPYGTAWAPSIEGQPIDLKASGLMYGKVEYKALGEKLRVALTTDYAKYQIGKRSPFPAQDGPLPDGYETVLENATNETLAAQFRAMSEGR